MKVNKNSITIIVERFIDALEATIEFEEKKEGKKERKKRKSKRFRKEQHFKHLSNFLHLNFTRKSMPKLFHVCLNFPPFHMYIHFYHLFLPSCNIKQQGYLYKFSGYKFFNLILPLSFKQRIHHLEIHSREINFNKFSKIKIPPFYKTLEEKLNSNISLFTQSFHALYTNLIIKEKLLSYRITGTNIP